jgi:hypothetical protein
MQVASCGALTSQTHISAVASSGHEFYSKNTGAKVSSITTKAAMRQGSDARLQEGTCKDSLTARRSDRWVTATRATHVAQILGTKAGSHRPNKR